MWVYNFNRLWSMVKRSPLASFVQHVTDLPLAMDLLRCQMPWRDRDYTRTVLNLAALQGALVTGESRRWLVPTSFTAASLASTGDKDTYPVHDYISVILVGVTFTTAGTTTPVRIEYDRRVTQGSDTGRVAMLDGSTAFVLAPSAGASQAIGAVIYKEIGHTQAVDLEPGDEVVSEVITACTSGVGRSIVLVVPRAKMFVDGTSTFASS